MLALRRSLRFVEGPALIWVKGSTRVLVRMAARALEIFVWSAAYALTKAAPDGSDVVYFAFGVCTDRWQR
jgi:hypothetical protein